MVLLSNVSSAQTQMGQDMDGKAPSLGTGTSVSMPNPYTIAIGGPWDGNNPNTSPGHVRVYEWNGSLWVQKGADITGEAGFNDFGNSVSMPTPNVLAVGAPYNNGSGQQAGHARVFRWDGTSWVQWGADLDAEAAYDHFGYSVSMSDSLTLAVGGPDNSGFATNAGHVRVFRWNGAAWVQKGGDIDGEAAFDTFGGSVSMGDSNTVGVGARYNDGNGSDSGHGRVFRWNGTAWVQMGQDIDGEDPGDQSGFSVSMPDSTHIAIGAPLNSEWIQNQGHTRVFRYNGSAWVKMGIDIDGETMATNAGYSVSMPDSLTLAVGGSGNEDNGTAAGHVRVYRWDGIGWWQDGIDIDGEAMGDRCGHSVSMGNPRCVGIGAPQNDGNGNASGHARVYYFCEAIQDSQVVSACDSYTWTNGVTYTSSVSGVTDTLQDFNGCDSVLVLDLTITSVTAAITNSGGTLTATQSGATYQWLDCAVAQIPIPGATSQSYTPTTNGSYAVVVTVNGCSDTSDCETVVALDDAAVGGIRVWPIPAQDELWVEFDQIQSGSATLYDLRGRLLAQRELGAQQIRFDLSGMPEGIYLLQIRTDAGGVKAVKVVVGR